MHRTTSPSADPTPHNIDDGGTDLTTPASAAESNALSPLVALRRWDLGGAWRSYTWWWWCLDPMGGGGGILVASVVLS
jgi:hypothetical protein